VVVVALFVVVWSTWALAVVADGRAAPLLRADPSFGKGGVVEPRLGGGYLYTSFRSAEVQPDGSILAARHGKTSLEDGTTLRRYSAAGKLDPSFRPENLDPTVEAVDAEGKRLVGGIDTVERFEPDGRLDPTFGIEPAGDKPYSDILPGKVEWIMPLPDGKIIVACAARNGANREVEEISIVRLDHQGRRDPGFGTDGEVNLKSSLDIPTGEFVGMAPHGEDGAIVLVDEGSEGLYEGDPMTQAGSIVLALGADGRPDPGYGEAGEVRSGSSIAAFKELGDGSLLVSGDSWGKRIDKERRESDLFAARLTPTGQYDLGFGEGGIVTVDFGGLDLGRSMLVGADGSVLLGGSSTALGDSLCLRFGGFCRETPVLARLHPDGTLDAGFGDGGKVWLDAVAEPFVPFGAGRGVGMLTALPDGGVLAGGGSGTAAFLARLDPAGGLMPAFGHDGLVIERDRDRPVFQATGVGVDGQGRIYVSASSNADALFSFETGAIFRFLPDGRLDRTYGGGTGLVRVPGDIRDIAVGRRGDLFVLNANNVPNFVVHVTAGGVIDKSFGEDGVAPLPRLPKFPRHGKLRNQEFSPRSIAIAPDGDVLVGGQGGTFNGGARIAVLRLGRHGRLGRGFGRSGFDVLDFGPTGECNMTELKVRSNGRILIAGRIRIRGEYGRRAALFQLLPDGSPDPAFGADGMVRVDVRTESVGTNVAIEHDGSVLLSGRQEVDGSTAPLLRRFSRAGKLDRGFAKTEQATIRAFLADGRIGIAREILPAAGQIFTVDPGEGGILAFSGRGAFRASVPFEPGQKPRRYLAAGALQRGGLLLVGQIGIEHGLLLRRYSPWRP
jgi:uncharacterized delta-60 repeat protein